MSGENSEKRTVKQIHDRRRTGPIFKNDDIKSEYHLFIYSDEVTNIRTISFDILGGDDGMRDISFIESIKDTDGNQLDRDNRPGFSINTFENFELNNGENKFVVKLKFNKKVQILIS